MTLIPTNVVSLCDTLLGSRDPLSPSLCTDNPIDFTDGDSLVDLFFHGEWCRRREVHLEFLKDRRGQWTVDIDFEVPDALSSVSFANAGRNLLVPLLTLEKDLMPGAHVDTRDEHDDQIPIASTRTSRAMSTAMLFSMAAQAGLCLNEVGSTIIELTSSNVNEASIAYVELMKLPLLDHDLNPKPCIGCQSRQRNLPMNVTGRDLVHEFCLAAKFLSRSVILLAELRDASPNDRKIVEFTFDAPIRLTKTNSERFGYVPLKVVPRVIFGGDAHSYHVEVQPPDNSVAVDTRLLFAHEKTSDSLFEVDGNSWKCENMKLPFPSNHWWGTSRRNNRYVETVTSETHCLGARECQLDQRRWSCVKGSAEPMAAHVRCGSDKFPRLIEGREAFAMFQFYPQSTGMIVEMVTAAWANLLFVFVLFSGLVWTHRLISVLDNAPETIMILGILVAGLGVGFTFYPKEHLLTSRIAQPFRLLVASTVFFTFAALVICVNDFIGQGATQLPNASARDLEVDLILSACACSYLALISFRAGWAQAAGHKYFWRKQGLSFRRLEFLQENAVEADDVSDRTKERRSRILHRLTVYARWYLVEDEWRKLFERGIPRAIRHESSQSGF